MASGSNCQNIHGQEQQKTRGLIKFCPLREPNRISLEMVVAHKWFPHENPVVVGQVYKFSCVKKKKRSSFVHLVVSTLLQLNLILLICSFFRQWVPGAVTLILELSTLPALCRWYSIHAPHTCQLFVPTFATSRYILSWCLHFSHFHGALWVIIEIVDK